jgi:hypothetical protein
LNDKKLLSISWNHFLRSVLLLVINKYEGFNPFKMDGKCYIKIETLKSCDHPFNFSQHTWYVPVMTCYVILIPNMFSSLYDTSCYRDYPLCSRDQLFNSRDKSFKFL